MPAMLAALRTLLACALAAGTFGATQVPPALEACAADVQRWCAEVASGHGRLLACLGEHEAEVADACRERIASLRAQRAGAAMGPRALIACERDLKTHCPGTASGQGRLKRCLDDNAAKVSERCKSAMAAEATAPKQGAARPSSPTPPSSTPAAAAP
jgi:hypothetical protein